MRIPGAQRMPDALRMPGELLPQHRKTDAAFLRTTVNDLMNYFQKSIPIWRNWIRNFYKCNKNKSLNYRRFQTPIQNDSNWIWPGKAWNEMFLAYVHIGSGTIFAKFVSAFWFARLWWFDTVSKLGRSLARLVLYWKVLASFVGSLFDPRCLW